ncbi:DUF2934 domain-containing protein [Candidatus Nitronereus thalassa]|uniref:DUF2934 domain-containing protein n=1 Tax=Candidatus Nitronereus thalassa TaxID=3020898 RepID=A0ABU3K8R9_9BACT|nr:DUF2934 domain-containing protein [Candidatus Nitronereus thalassa]MDT7042783.1 DUF2934 domain-containing protein [Candidatus Nitronereus thalassa]
MARKQVSSLSDKPKKSAGVLPKSQPQLRKKSDSLSRTTSRSGSKKLATVEATQNGSPSDPPDLYARIADRAYELYTHRGGHHGQDQADWLEAERQVLKEGC